MPSSIYWRQIALAALGAVLLVNAVPVDTLTHRPCERRVLAVNTTCFDLTRSTANTTSMLAAPTPTVLTSAATTSAVTIYGNAGGDYKSYPSQHEWLSFEDLVSTCIPVGFCASRYQRTHFSRLLFQSLESLVQCR